MDLITLFSTGGLQLCLLGVVVFLCIKLSDVMMKLLNHTSDLTECLRELNEKSSELNSHFINFIADIREIKISLQKLEWPQK